MKILVIRFSSIGDIVLTTPVVRCLRKQYPDAEIHYATKPAFQSILSANPYINKIHVLSGALSQLVTQLKQENFDFVIDLHHNQRTLLLRTMLGVKSSAFNKINMEKWLMVNFKIDKLPHVHIVDRYLAACAQLGVTNDGEGLDYFISKNDEVQVHTLGEAFSKGYIGWVIGAKQNTKKFPIEKIASAVNSPAFPKLPVVLLGGKEDTAAGEYLVQKINNTKVYNACGLYSLNQSASLVKQAQLIVANDTGLMHIAAACKKKIISIWGNTIPAFGMYPYYGKYNVPNAFIQVTDLKCRPCSKLGYATCPKGHFKCMNDISEQLLIGKIKELLAAQY